MKKSYIYALMLLVAAGTQGTVINFTDNTEYPVGANIWAHDDWSGSGIGTDSSAVGSASGIQVGMVADNDWDFYYYNAETFDSTAVGTVLESSITFTFDPTSGNGWQSLNKTGCKIGNTTVFAYFQRAGNGNYANSEYNIKLGETTSSFIYGSDLGFEADTAGQTSDELTLTYTLTKTAADTWNGLVTLNNNASDFSISQSIDGITASGDSAIGFWGNGRPLNDNASFTVSEFSVIPEPATLGLVGTFGFLMLVLRRKFAK